MGDGAETFLTRTPKPPLDAFVESIWFYDSPPRPHRLERLLPTGTAQLIVNLKEDRTRIYSDRGIRTAPGTVLSGPRTSYCVIDTAEQECVAGVVFRPGGTIPFFRVPANELIDDVPMDLLWNRLDTSELRERLLAAPSPGEKLDAVESVLRAKLAPIGLHPAVAFALGAFANGSSVACVSHEIGLSRKRFIEKFKAMVGIAPKHYYRILRFQNALALADKRRRLDWTSIAVDCGYFDQSHFIHDFKAFSGLTPTGYEAGRTQFRNHVKILQS